MSSPSAAPNSQSRSQTSPSISRSNNNVSHQDPVAPIKDKIRLIESRLAEIRQKRKEMELEEIEASNNSNLHGFKARMKSPPKDYSKPLKAYFHHPQLEYVFGEIVHSP